MAGERQLRGTGAPIGPKRQRRTADGGYFVSWCKGRSPAENSRPAAVATGQRGRSPSAASQAINEAVMGAGSGLKDKEVWQSGAFAQRRWRAMRSSENCRSAELPLYPYHGPKQPPAANRQSVAYVGAGSG